MNKQSKIYIAGHNGMVGSAIQRNLVKHNYKNILTIERKKLDLRAHNAVEKFFKKEKPEYVFLCAAKVGGIFANIKYPADFILDNLKIQNNIIENAYKYNVKKLIMLGSSCMYPKSIENNIKESELLTGEMEETNLPYAVAKIAGKILCDAFKKQYNLNCITVMPSNLYGINDNFDKNNSHLVAGIMSKIYEAKILEKKFVTLWGSGNPLRELLFVDDLAEACILLMKKNIKYDLINIGSKDEISVKNLSKLIAHILEYKGEIKFDYLKPDGVKRKKMNSDKIIKLGWKQKTTLKNGLVQMFQWYLNNFKNEKNFYSHNKL